MKGSSELFAEFFFAPRETHLLEYGGPPEDPIDFFLFKPEHLDWLRERRCELMKVDCGPGDFVIWDSRTMHYASFPEGEIMRTVFYICYTPVSVGREDLESRRDCLSSLEGRAIGSIVILEGRSHRY